LRTWRFNVAILSTIGLVPLAVTTSLTINFLRKPSARNPIVGRMPVDEGGPNLVVGEWRFTRIGSKRWWRTRWARIQYRRIAQGN